MCVFWWREGWGRDKIVRNILYIIVNKLRVFIDMKRFLEYNVKKGIKRIE